MTIALVVKVHDGLVLASDSATTLTMSFGGASAVANIYNNANKVFNLYKGLPVGAMTWGLGSIGPASIATLAKDLRRRFTGNDPSFADWKLDPENYLVSDVAARAREFLNDGRYEVVEAEAAAQGQPAPYLGFLVAGYSSGADQPEAYVIELGENGSPDIATVVPDEAGAAWWGQPDAIARILNGMSIAFPDALVNRGLVSTAADAAAIYGAVREELNPQMVTAAMPIQDAIDLAEFLVHATIQVVRFSPGNPTVGGPIEIATISKHEDFKWVRRKHFFETRLNPLNGAS
ncbi:hypothetical protein [Microbacterium sp. CJ88]|uniref:hypothetical protein n=1 Tax=Microbacterium sp. CJ88 TaxID=3445672 RepID=UPI003F655984